MVYSEELGYDPEIWEECESADHWLAFGWFTRLVLAFGAIVFAVGFFYVLEKRKLWAKAADANERQTNLTTTTSPKVSLIMSICRNLQMSTTNC